MELRQYLGRYTAVVDEEDGQFGGANDESIDETWTDDTKRASIQSISRMCGRRILEILRPLFQVHTEIHHQISSREWLILAASTCIILYLIIGRSAVERSRQNFKVNARCGSNLYNTPGFLWRTEDGSDIRYIPYTDANTITQRPIREVYSEALDPNSSDTDASPPSFSTHLETDPTSAQLQFARNRLVVIIGDSHDRKNVESMCARIPGSIGSPFDRATFHIKTYCTVPQIDLTILFIFSFGLIEESEEWYPKWEHNEPPFSVERRIDQILLPELKANPNLPEPSLVIFQSGYWDLRYFAMKSNRDHLGDEGRIGFHRGLERYERSIYWSELKWHRSRLFEVLGHLQKVFPGSEVMTRTIQPHHSTEDLRNVGVFDWNESIRAAARAAGTRVMRWGDLVVGSTNYEDDQHFQMGSLENKLWIDMILYELERTISGCSYLND